MHDSFVMFKDVEELARFLAIFLPLSTATFKVEMVKDMYMLTFTGAI